MNLVFDVIHCDSLELVVPRTRLSEGRTHKTMDESVRALCESLHIELIDYEVAQRLCVNDKVHISIVSGAWVKRLGR